MFYAPSTDTMHHTAQHYADAHPGAGPLETEEQRNAAGLFTLYEIPPAYNPLTHGPALDGVDLLEGVYHARYTLVALTPDQLRALVPAKVTRRQARQALLLAGLLDDVQPAINAIPDPVQRGLAQIEWDDSQEFERNRPLLIQLGAALGLDSAALDQLFIAAHAL